MTSRFPPHASRALLGAALLLIVTAAPAAEQGADLYKTYCVQCHGIRGDGKGVNVPDMSVQPRNHADAQDMATRTDDELFKAIKEGGQAISKSVLMPPWGGNFTDEQIHALVAYLRELCQCRHGG